MLKSRVAHGIPASTGEPRKTTSSKNPNYPVKKMSAITKKNVNTKKCDRNITPTKQKVGGSKSHSVIRTVTSNRPTSNAVVKKHSPSTPKKVKRLHNSDILFIPGPYKEKHHPYSMLNDKALRRMRGEALDQEMTSLRSLTSELDEKNTERKRKKKKQSAVAAVTSKASERSILFLPSIDPPSRTCLSKQSQLLMEENVLDADVSSISTATTTPMTPIRTSPNLISIEKKETRNLSKKQKKKKSSAACKKPLKSVSGADEAKIFPAQELLKKSKLQREQRTVPQSLATQLSPSLKKKSVSNVNSKSMNNEKQSIVVPDESSTVFSAETVESMLLIESCHDDMDTIKFLNAVRKCTEKKSKRKKTNKQKTSSIKLDPQDVERPRSRSDRETRSKRKKKATKDNLDKPRSKKKIQVQSEVHGSKLKKPLSRKYLESETKEMRIKTKKPSSRKLIRVEEKATGEKTKKSKSQNNIYIEKSASKKQRSQHEDKPDDIQTQAKKSEKLPIVVESIPGTTTKESDCDNSTGTIPLEDIENWEKISAVDLIRSLRSTSRNRHEVDSKREQNDEDQSQTSRRGRSVPRSSNTLLSNEEAFIQNGKDARTRSATPPRLQPVRSNTSHSRRSTRTIPLSPAAPVPVNSRRNSRRTRSLSMTSEDKAKMRRQGQPIQVDAVVAPRKKKGKSSSSRRALALTEDSSTPTKSIKKKSKKPSSTRSKCSTMSKSKRSKRANEPDKFSDHLVTNIVDLKHYKDRIATEPRLDYCCHKQEVERPIYEGASPLSLNDSTLKSFRSSTFFRKTGSLDALILSIETHNSNDDGNIDLENSTVKPRPEELIVPSARTGSTSSTDTSCMSNDCNLSSKIDEKMRKSNKKIGFSFITACLEKPRSKKPLQNAVKKLSRGLFKTLKLRGVNSEAKSSTSVKTISREQGESNAFSIPSNSEHDHRSCSRQKSKLK